MGSNALNYNLMGDQQSALKAHRIHWLLDRARKMQCLTHDSKQTLIASGGDFL